MLFSKTILVGSYFVLLNECLAKASEPDSWNARQTNTFDLDSRQTNSCGSKSTWQATSTAWQQDGVDRWLSDWWSKDRLNANASFAHDLGYEFGSHEADFTCGIGEISRCPSPGCTEFDSNGDPPAAYLAVVAIAKLNTLFNDISTGISSGQEDFQGLANDVFNTFIKPYQQPSANGLGAFIAALVTVLASFLILIPEIGPGAEALINGGATLLGVGVQELLASKPISITDVSVLDTYSAQFSEKARKNLQDWADDTFAGRLDTNNNSVLEYLSGGGFTQATLPKPSDIEQFYKKQMVSRVVDAQWRAHDTYIMKYRPQASCVDKLDTGIPHFFDKANCTQSLIVTAENYKTYPIGWAQINNTNYNISATDIITSSLQSWAAAKGNYTVELATSRFKQLFGNISGSPFEQGAALEVCDISMNGCVSTDIFGFNYTLCCGRNCEDTHAFNVARSTSSFQLPFSFDSVTAEAFGICSGVTLYPIKIWLAVMLAVLTIVCNFLG